MASLADSRIIVVGGSSGIGLGVAAAALARGARVVLVSRSPKKLEAAAKGSPRRGTSRRWPPT